MTSKKNKVMAIFKKLLNGIFIFPESMIRYQFTHIDIVQPRGSSGRWENIVKSEDDACRRISFSEFKEVAKEIADSQGLGIVNITDHNSGPTYVYKFVILKKPS